MVDGWPLTFSHQGQIRAPRAFVWENIEMSFYQNILQTNGWNVQFIIILLKLFSYNQNFAPWGLSALVPRLYTCTKFVTFKYHLWNRSSNFHQISHGAFCQKGIDSLFKLFKLFCFIEQDGCHAHIRQNIFFSRTKKALRLNLYSIGDSKSISFIQMMIVGWPLTFLTAMSNSRPPTAV